MGWNVYSTCMPFPCSSDGRWVALEKIGWDGWWFAPEKIRSVFDVELDVIERVARSALNHRHIELTRGELGLHPRLYGQSRCSHRATRTNQANRIGATLCQFQWEEPIGNAFALTSGQRIWLRYRGFKMIGKKLQKSGFDPSSLQMDFRRVSLVCSTKSGIIYMQAFVDLTGSPEQEMFLLWCILMLLNSPIANLAAYSTYKAL